MRWLALFLFCFITFLSVSVSMHVPVLPMGTSLAIPGIDKVAHFLLMGLLALLVSLGFGPSRFRGQAFGVPRSAMLVMAFVTIDELAQIFLVARQFSVLDLAASYAGVGLFSLLASRTLTKPVRVPPDRQK